jgi:hypothetical protein
VVPAGETVAYRAGLVPPSPFAPAGSVEGLVHKSPSRYPKQYRS